MSTRKPALRPSPKTVMGSLVLALLVGACGDGGDVAGTWSCIVGSDGGYLFLEQSGDSVTGEYCEHEDCDGDHYPLQSGAVDGESLTFFYTFGSDRCDVNMTLDGDKLQGPWDCSKASSPLDGSCTMQ